MSNGFRAGCPACMASGGDPEKTHLFIFRDGAYGCAANQDNKEHTELIFRLAGKQEGDQSNEAPKEYSYTKPELEIEVFFKEEDLNRLMPVYDYWNGRGVSSRTLEFFRGGLSINNSMNGRFCFPIFDEKGRIHGMTGRWAQPGKHSIPWKKIGKSSTWVYPLYFNKEDIRKSGHVILVESVGDMLALWEAGFKCVLVIFGASISQILIARLVGLNPDKIYVATNNDVKHTAGQDAARKIKGKLDNFFDDGVVEIKLPPKKDFGIMNNEEIMEWGKDLYVRQKK